MEPGEPKRKREDADMGNQDLLKDSGDTIATTSPDRAADEDSMILSICECPRLEDMAYPCRWLLRLDDAAQEGWSEAPVGGHVPSDGKM